MTQDYKHPITPPPELVQRWNEETIGTNYPFYGYSQSIAALAAQWGSDQELEACCEWLDREGWSGESRQLRAARRPEPPSLKEQALETLRVMRIEPCIIDGVNVNAELQAKYDIIRRALEQLDD